MHDWIQKFDRFWADHLTSIQKVAEQKAKQLAARDASNKSTFSKEQNHGH